MLITHYKVCKFTISEWLRNKPKAFEYGKHKVEAKTSAGVARSSYWTKQKTNKFTNLALQPDLYWANHILACRQ